MEMRHGEGAAIYARYSSAMQKPWTVERPSAYQRKILQIADGEDLTIAQPS